MSKVRKPYTQRTEAEFEHVLKNYNSKTIFELANDLNLDYTTIWSMVSKLRKSGFNLPSKNRNRVVIDILDRLAKKYKV